MDIEQFLAAFPPQAEQLLLVLFLSFLVGLEREWRPGAATAPVFAGVRTFPLLGLTGYGLALVSGTSPWPVAAGVVAVGGLMAVSFHGKLAAAHGSGRGSGFTSEISALLVFVLGLLVAHDLFWISAAVAIAAVLLLELKGALERLSRRVPHGEILTFAQFLVLTVVILPAVPDQDFTRFHLNPFKTWAVVVAVATISYGSYVLQKLLRGRGGLLLAAVLGGAYSSTVATVSLAKRAATGGRPRLFAGAILVASGVMYLRLAILVSLFNGDLMVRLAPTFVALGVAGLGAGFLWSRIGADGSGPVEPVESRNPLELSAAFLFAAVFLAMVVVTHVALSWLGKGGVYALATLMGVSDVDPFILSVTQSAGHATPLRVAAGAIAVAAASNNVIKGLYARGFACNEAGTQALGLLVGLAVLGLAPLAIR